VPETLSNRSFLENIHKEIQYQKLIGRPIPVDAPIQDRMLEILLGKNLCSDNTTSQKYLYFHIEQEMMMSVVFRRRLMIWFYQFMFFEDPVMDLSAKHVVPDTLRYVDESKYAAAARIVHRLRRASPNGIFFTFHCPLTCILISIPIWCSTNSRENRRDCFTRYPTSFDCVLGDGRHDHFMV
jgi:hypothetical protein